MTQIAVAVLILLSFWASEAAAQVAPFGPLLPSERKTEQTGRDVRAEDYRDAYCGTWTDGCSTCIRKTANDPPMCKPDSADATCKRSRVVCRRMLSTYDRVCLYFSDGCNECSVDGACSAMMCFRTLPDGTKAPPLLDAKCLVLRRGRYDDLTHTRLDLIGQWQIIAPNGRSCEFASDMMRIDLHYRCLGLPRVRAIKSAEVEPNRLILIGPGVRFTFSTEENLDSLPGIGQAAGWRLIRLDPKWSRPSDRGNQWEISADDVRLGCRVFLAMRRGLGRRPGSLKPGAVATSSRCREPFTHRAETNGRTRDGAAKLPRWTRWDYTTGSITLIDDAGHGLRFEQTVEGFAANWVDPGGRRVRLELRRAF